MKIFISYRCKDSAWDVGRVRDQLEINIDGRNVFRDLPDIPSGADFRKVRQWTHTLWGEKRLRPDARYIHPWKDDLRNNKMPIPRYGGWSGKAPERMRSFYYAAVYASDKFLGIPI